MGAVAKRRRGAEALMMTGSTEAGAEDVLENVAKGRLVGRHGQVEVQTRQTRADDRRRTQRVQVERWAAAAAAQRVS
jgi:hypothetical protein